eukprot:4089678-Prymnesium_polylepis.1
MPPAGVVVRHEWGTQAFLASLPRPGGSASLPASPERKGAPRALPRLASPHPVLHQYHPPALQPAAPPQHRPPPLLPEAQGVFEAFDVSGTGSLDAAQLREAL